MRPTSDGKTRRSAEEWKQIHARFVSSGLTVRAFCDREDLVVSSLARWHRTFTANSDAPKRQAPRSGSQPSFIEVSPPPSPQMLSTPWSAELDLGNGVVLRVRT